MCQKTAQEAGTMSEYTTGNAEGTMKRKGSSENTQTGRKEGKENE